MNNCQIMGLLHSRFETGYDECLDRIMWWANFLEYEKLALNYFNFKRNTAIKIFNQVLAQMSIDLHIRETICPNKDHLHQILKNQMIKPLIEVKSLRQKYSFEEFIKRRDAKLMKGYKNKNK